MNDTENKINNDENSRFAHSPETVKKSEVLSRRQRKELLKLYKKDTVDDTVLFTKGIASTDFDYVYAMSRKSGLSSFESFYNAVYINSLYKLDNSKKKVTDELVNTFAHPKGWYGDSVKMLKSNFWSEFFAFLQLIPIISDKLIKFFSALPKKLRKKYKRSTEKMDNSLNLVAAFGKLLRKSATVLLAVILIAPVTFYLHFKVVEEVALEVFVNGESIGIARTYDEITTVKKNVESFVSESIGESFWFNDEITYKLVKKKSQKLLDVKELQKTMISLAKSKYIVPGYTLLVDGVEVAKSIDSSVLDAARNELIIKFEENARGKGSKEAVVSYANDIVITPSDIHIDSLQDESEIRQLLGLQPKTGYENLPKDPLYTLYYDTILKNVEISKVEDASMVISGVGTDDIISGVHNPMEVTLGYVIIKNEEVKENIPYEIEYIESDNYLLGSEKVETFGKQGSRIATYAVSYKDGKEVDRKFVEEKIVKPAENRIVYKGTRIPSPEELATIATGKFIIPYDNYLSCSYRFRTIKELGNVRELHNAWDIPGPYGSEIAASDGGVVSKVAYSSGYGRHVIIDHENGYETLYAHLSKATVKEGERVGQGDTIGKMGATGRVTGVHVHFEIRKDGVSIDPATFIENVEEKY